MAELIQPSRGVWQHRFAFGSPVFVRRRLEFQAAIVPDTLLYRGHPSKEHFTIPDISAGTFFNATA